ncbi:hypothetical protein [Puia dinghuensis]|uniref:Uncharacterized protein n=1 Tax=Puia dinghuensis TaxID=1792502 RepID=A0A8J2UAF5_9BACT|nr:hypothetical protein [Puia dinghuensis]GGA90255.1 hypothetical protein GCM10011511_11880 [Puia dinghuensis]
MRKFTLAAFALLFLTTCGHRKTLTEQLNTTFSDHLKRLDSSATLDSVHVRWNVPVTQRFGRIFDDTIYVREYTRIKAQLSKAQQKNDKDSIAFYQYEIGYMEKEIDSISRSIGQGDTSRRFGYLIGCAYFISKNDKSKMDSTMIFIDSTNTIRFTDYLDSALRRSVRSLD